MADYNIIKNYIIKTFIKERVKELNERKKIYVCNAYKIDLINAQIRELNLLRYKLKKSNGEMIE